MSLNSSSSRWSPLAIGGLVVIVVLAVVAGVFVGVNIADDDEGRSDSASGGLGDLLAAATTTTTSTSTTEAIPLSFTAEQIAVEFGSAVWRVQSEGCGEAWTGTAFAIGPDLLVTNHHVVSNDPTPELISRNGDTIDATVIGWSERPDLAILEVDTELDEWLKWSPTDEINEGERLVVLGYPVPDTDFTVTPGSVISFQRRSDVREAIRSDAAIDRGNSGGPALDASGRVMGVVTEMATNDGGFQLVPLIFTHDALADTIRGILADPDVPEAQCGDADDWGSEPVPDEFDEAPATWESGAERYGDHPVLDGLW
ncbi:MAG: trypsin-like peptidase domain-containing protein, partial [Acidimicrobiia bacterium]|nr:trypsin-like peptidase domain-containing protein [Acidimicrobiia bacterium]